MAGSPVRLDASVTGGAAPIGIYDLNGNPRVLQPYERLIIESFVLTIDGSMAGIGPHISFLFSDLGGGNLVPHAGFFVVPLGYKATHVYRWEEQASYPGVVPTLSSTSSVQTDMTGIGRIVRS
jgi:hypothetical protein